MHFSVVRDSSSTLQSSTIMLSCLRVTRQHDVLGKHGSWIVRLNLLEDGGKQVPQLTYSVKERKEAFLGVDARRTEEQATPCLSKNQSLDYFFENFWVVRFFFLHLWGICLTWVDDDLGCEVWFGGGEVTGLR